MLFTRIADHFPRDFPLEVELSLTGESQKFHTRKTGVVPERAEGDQRREPDASQKRGRMPGENSQVGRRNVSEILNESIEEIDVRNY